MNRQEKMLQVFNDVGCIRCPMSIRGDLVQRRLRWIGHTSSRLEAEQIISFYLTTPPRGKLTKGLPKIWATTSSDELNSEPGAMLDGERVG